MEITQTSILYPISWLGSISPNFVLGTSATITTGNTFSAVITFTNTDNNPVGNQITLSPTSGNQVIGLAMQTFEITDFPITISSAITCNTPFGICSAEQEPLGIKVINSNTVPVCYQSTVFCNDNANNPNSDNDWNDLVLTFQLYNSSTD